MEYVMDIEGYYDAYYKKAQQVRTLVKNEFARNFEKYDVILIPTASNVAFDIGSKINDPLEMYLADLCTVPVNIAGLPGISVPCGLNSEGMPIGFQLIGKPFAESTILNAAYTYEQNTFNKNEDILFLSYRIWWRTKHTLLPSMYGATWSITSIK